MKRLLPILGFLGMFSMIACEPNNPFDTGPAYDLEGNLKIDSLKIVAFLDTAQIDSLYRIYDPSGVVIIVQEEGSGTRPTAGNIVYTDYTGSLMEDGTIFDSSIEAIAVEADVFDSTRNYTPFEFQIDQTGAGRAISGWNFAFKRLRPGSKAVLVIPSPWGYADAGFGTTIPENAPLVFKVDFLGID